MKTSMTLADLAVTHPAASRIFYRNGLDYCCGGRRSLEEACTERGIDSTRLLEEIGNEEAGAASDRRWDGSSIHELIAFIVDHYHARLRIEIPELVTMARKVGKVHGDKASCPTGLPEHLEAVLFAVNDHLNKEEGILFPLILSGRGVYAAGPIRVMENEHREHAANLRRTRQLTNNLTVPPEACATWRALYLRLGALESELMEHIHLENNLLFQRALNE